MNTIIDWINVSVAIFLGSVALGELFTEEDESLYFTQSEFEQIILHFIAFIMSFFAIWADGLAYSVLVIGYILLFYIPIRFGNSLLVSK